MVPMAGCGPSTAALVCGATASEPIANTAPIANPGMRIDLLQSFGKRIQINRKKACGPAEATQGLLTHPWDTEKRPLGHSLHRAAITLDRQRNAKMQPTNSGMPESEIFPILN